MSVPLQAPALPWGSTNAQRAAQEKQEHANAGEANSDVQGVSIDQLGLSLGDRIEVKWQVHTDEGDPIQRWWGASIAAAEPSTASSSGAPAYKIKYDTWPDGGFDEEEEAEVALLSSHRLLDLRQSDVMAWRRQGEDYDPPESEDDEGGSGLGSGAEDDADDAELAEGGSVSMQELAASISDADVSAAEADMLSMAGNLGAAPHHVAAGYRDFIENLKQFIAAKASQAEGSGQRGLLITAADVADFKAMMMTQAAAGRGRSHRAA